MMRLHSSVKVYASRVPCFGVISTIPVTFVHSVVGKVVVTGAWSLIVAAGAGFGFLAAVAIVVVIIVIVLLVSNELIIVIVPEITLDIVGGVATVSEGAINTALRVAIPSADYGTLGRGA
jgi:hypothetical protein